MAFFFSYKQKYHNEQIKRQIAERLYTLLLNEHNKLIDRINAAGGSKVFTKNQQFSTEELRTILILCHPDKHNGSKTATRIAARINEIRNG